MAVGEGRVRYRLPKERIYVADELDELDERLRALVAEWRSADVHPEHRSGLRIAADQLEALLAERP